MSNETVLITGASSGIGWELAKLFAADGSHLILVARREEKLQNLADDLHVRHGTQTTIVPLDLSERGNADELFRRVTDDGHVVDVLVNNAGFGQFGRFAKTSLDRHLGIIQVNLAALVHLTHLFLEPMLERQSGTILNLGSTASFQPGPNAAVYYATKAFVLSFSEALWDEVRESNVHVSCLCPGPTKTGFGEESNMDQTPVFKYNSMRVEAVARAGFYGVRRRKRLVMPGLVNNLLSWSVRFTPRRILLHAMRQLQPIDENAD